MSPESIDQYKPLKEDEGTVEIGKEEEEGTEKQGDGEETVVNKLTVEEMVNK